MDYAKEYDRMVEQSNKQQEEITQLRAEFATVKQQRDGLAIKHEVACDTIIRQRADIDTIRGYLDAMKASCERIAKQRDELVAALVVIANGEHEKHLTADGLARSALAKVNKCE